MDRSNSEIVIIGLRRKRCNTSILVVDAVTADFKAYFEFVLSFDAALVDFRCLQIVSFIFDILIGIVPGIGQQTDHSNTLVVFPHHQDKFQSYI